MAKIGRDDYSLSRVPRTERFGFFSMLLQWLAMSGSLSQFVLGATLGLGMTFQNAFLSFTLGAVILEVVIFAVGAAGQREGLSMTLLTRFAGFGRNGSTLVSLVIAVSLIGWFGVQNGIFGTSMTALVGGPSWLWCILAGLALTLLVMYGFKIMMWLAKIAVPLFFGLVAFSIWNELSHHSIPDLVNMPPAGAAISIPAAATIIAGGYMTGAITSPDMTRFNRKAWHVMAQSSCSMILSEYIVGMTGVLLGHAAGTSNVSKIVLGSSGFIGLIIVILATAKINDWNLYSSSLGVANFVQTVFGKKVQRGVITVAIGILGTALSAIGFLDHFKDFLSLLGVAIPPVGGIIVAEYWFVRRLRKPLDDTRESGAMPAQVAAWVPASLVVWAIAFCVGKFVPWGIPTINSLVTALVLYSVLALLGLVRPSRLVAMEPSAAPHNNPVPTH
ncbi:MULTISPECIES: cytosine permease [Arthrobacter]|uniref:Cytosine permease n=1 Tax=Arthrobacter terricola TaxID=2547396 RepID=A0A4R5K7V6_9MICC|nr:MULTISPECIES: cytosine permease [Arthrobacter]MBT8163294.1 cytosine permease [Arthrobacter sp. GN70]TDF90986.1 cytosine permease [Arthrobacter terricola]